MVINGIDIIQFMEIGGAINETTPASVINEVKYQLAPAELSKLNEDFHWVNSEIEKLGIFDGVSFSPRAYMTGLQDWQESTGVSDQWIENNHNRVLMCCKRDESGFYLKVAIKNKGQDESKPLTDDERREYIHEWAHVWQNTQMVKNNQTGSLFVMERGFIAEAACEVIARDLAGFGKPVELPNGQITIKEIREKGFFAVDQKPVGENSAYYSAYLWLRNLIGTEGRAVDTEQMKSFLDTISHCSTTEELDSKLEEKYSGYLESINK